jgi:hypothetical protein
MVQQSGRRTIATTKVAMKEKDNDAPPPAPMTLYQLLESRYNDEHSILLYEVRDSTGFDSSRSADAMSISLYRTRGREVNGFEIKHSRSDWLRELKDPAKAEEIGKYCDYFYLLTPDDTVAKVDELPIPWGWMVPKGQRFKVMKKAQKMDPRPIDRHILCSLLYTLRAKCYTDINKQIEEQVSEKLKSRHSGLKYQLESAQEKLEQLKTAVHTFENASGLSIGGSWMSTENNQKIGETVRYVMNNKKVIEKFESDLEWAAKRAQHIADDINRNLERVRAERPVTDEIPDLTL